MLGITIKYALIYRLSISSAFFCFILNFSILFIFKHFKCNTNTWHQSSINQEIVFWVCMDKLNVFWSVFLNVSLIVVAFLDLFLGWTSFPM